MRFGLEGLKKRKKLACWLAALLLMSLFVTVSLVRAETIGGQIIFKVAYVCSADKTVPLRWYSDRMFVTHSGHVPQSVGEFLVKRLKSTSSSREFDAIMAFWAPRGGWGAYWLITGIQSADREEIVACLVRNIDHFEGSDCVGALILIEEIRTLDFIGKSRICLAADEKVSIYSSGGTGQRPVDEDVLAEAKTTFRAWWNSSGSAQEKLAHSPFLGSKVLISGLDYIPQP